MFHEERLSLVKKVFVNNGEYNFTDEQQAEEFARKLLSQIEDDYISEGFYHKYDTLDNFIYSHHADSIAFFLYEDKYELSEV